MNFAKIAKLSFTGSSLFHVLLAKIIIGIIDRKLNKKKLIILEYIPGNQSFPYASSEFGIQMLVFD